MADRDSRRFRSFYAEEAAVYHRRRYGGGYGSLFRALHHETLRELIGARAQGLRCLEIACGTGHTSALLAAMGLELTACDLTPEMMREARERTAGNDPPVHFSIADAQRLPYADADAGHGFDVVVTTRFLHLFPAPEQGRILAEAARVLRPGGRLLVDFDNWSARWLLAVPILFYNLVRYRRLAPYARYNRIAATVDAIERSGFDVERVVGVGGIHLGAAQALSPRWAARLGRAHREQPLRLLAEQFMVLGRKR